MFQPQWPYVPTAMNSLLRFIKEIQIKERVEDKIYIGNSSAVTSSGYPSMTRRTTNVTNVGGLEPLAK